MPSGAHGILVSKEAEEKKRNVLPPAYDGILYCHKKKNGNVLPPAYNGTLVSKEKKGEGVGRGVVVGGGDVLLPAYDVVLVSKEKRKCPAACL